jgi:hypothetical protein
MKKNIGILGLIATILLVLSITSASADPTYAVLDANGSLYRVEIKGTGQFKEFSTTSGERSGKQIVKTKGTSKTKPLAVIDCDWLIGSTSMDSSCWIIPVEFIEVLQLKKVSINQIEMFKEKWNIFLSVNPNIKPYLKDGYRNQSITKLQSIATSIGVNPATLGLPFKFKNGIKKYSLSQKDRLVIAIWEKIFSDIII